MSYGVVLCTIKSPKINAAIAQYKSPQDCFIVFYFIAGLLSCAKK